MAKLNRNVRFLVLNRTNQVISPKSENLPGFEPGALKAAGEIPKKYSPSFAKEETAKAFGAALAARYAGERFYLAKVTAGVMIEPATGPWVATGTALADEHMADEGDDESLDDGTENE